MVEEELKEGYSSSELKEGYSSSELKEGYSPRTMDDEGWGVQTEESVCTTPGSERSSEDTALERWYVKIDAIGRGSTSVVHRAVETRSGRFAAVKTATARDADRGSLAKEAGIIRSLLAVSSRPPGLLEYTSVRDEAIVCEYAARGSLESCLGKNFFPSPYLGEIARTLIHALAFVHGAGVTHRDVKPSNVLVFADGSVKLADFSLATLRQKCDDFCGTFQYLAPERLQGQAYDASADIWGFGALVLNLALDGQPARRFSVDEGFWPALELYESDDCYDEILRASSDVPQVCFSPTFQRFVKSCLKVDAPRRPPASELLADSHSWPFVQARWPPEKKRQHASSLADSDTRRADLFNVLDTLKRGRSHADAFVFEATHLRHFAAQFEVPVSVVRAAVQARAPALSLLSDNSSRSCLTS